MFSSRIASFLVILLLSVFPALAATNALPAVGIVTGPATGTYYRFGHDIANVLQHYGVQLDVKESQGSIENVRRINSAENAALGIVQSDLLGFLKRSEDATSREIARHLRVVFPFYKEEIHVFARKDIKNFSDLQGKRLVVGAEGSGHWLTSMNLLAMTGVRPADLQRLAPAEAVVAVLQNRADAMIFVGGKPVKLFKNLEDLAKGENPAYKPLLEQVHFVPLNDKKLLAEYSASGLSPSEYSFITQPVPTVAVQAVMVSYGFEGENNNDPYRKQRCEMIGRVGQGLRDALPNLQQNGHPKWREVSLQTPANSFWQVDECVTTVFAEPKGADPLEDALLKTIQQKW